MLLTLRLKYMYGLDLWLRTNTGVGHVRTHMVHNTDSSQKEHGDRIPIEVDLIVWLASSIEEWVQPHVLSLSTVNLNCSLCCLYFTISLTYCSIFIHVMEQQHS